MYKLNKSKTLTKKLSKKTNKKNCAIFSDFVHIKPKGKKHETKNPQLTMALSHCFRY